METGSTSMTQLTQRPIHHGGAAGTSSGGAAGAALWLIACGCFGLAGVARGQQSYLTLSNASVTSGSFTYQAGTSITANNGFAVSGCATVTLASGNSIILGPGFTATAGGTGTTFEAGINLPLSANTITSSPAGQQVTVDCMNYSTPQVFTWAVGSQHTISAAATVSAAGVQETLTGWSDSGAAAHTITVGAPGGTYTANYVTQYFQLTTAAVGAGTVTVSPPSTGGWYAPGTPVTITATPNAGNQFQGFTGTTTTTTASTSAISLTVTMSGPVTETAQFGPVYTISVLQGTATVAAGGETANYLLAVQPAGYAGQIGSGSMKIDCHALPYEGGYPWVSQPVLTQNADGTISVQVVVTATDLHLLFGHTVLPDDPHLGRRPGRPAVHSDDEYIADAERAE